MIVKKGQMITFAEGEYSDYCVNGLVCVVSEFDLTAAKNEWYVENTKEEQCKFRQRVRRTVTGTEFLPWLVGKGLVEDVPYIEVHTGSYGDPDVTWDGET